MSVQPLEKKMRKMGFLYMLCKPWLRSPGQRNSLSVLCGRRRPMSERCYLILSSGSDGKMQAVTTVQKPPLPCPFKRKGWMEEDRTRAIWRNTSRGLFAV